MSPKQYGKVVVVADGSRVTEEIRRVLERGGFTSAVVCGRPDELAAIETKGPVALVLLVLEQDPPALAVRAWLDGLGARIPFVVVSGEDDLAAVLRHAERLRPDAWIVRPFSATQLLSSVALVSRGRAEYDAADESGEHPVASPHEVLRRIAHVLESAGVYPRTDETPTRVIAAYPGCELLSARERQVVEELVRHRSVARVARTLHLSEHTVRNHRKSIYWKLDVHSQDELVDLATGRTFEVSPLAP